MLRNNVAVWWVREMCNTRHDHLSTSSLPLSFSFFRYFNNLSSTYNKYLTIYIFFSYKIHIHRCHVLLPPCGWIPLTSHSHLIVLQKMISFLCHLCMTRKQTKRSIILWLSVIIRQNHYITLTSVNKMLRYNNKGNFDWLQTMYLSSNTVY